MKVTIEMEILQNIAEHYKLRGHHSNTEYAKGIYMVLDTILRDSDSPLLVCSDCEEWFDKRKANGHSVCGCVAENERVVTKVFHMS